MINKKLKELQPGDIVWAKRYQNEKEKKNYRKGHREGPFIIFKKNKDDTYFGFLCSSTIDSDGITLENLEPVGLYNHSFIALSLRRITEFTYERYISELPSNFFEDLKRRLALRYANKYKMTPDYSSFSIKPDIGDIVETSNGSKFYLYEHIPSKPNCFNAFYVTKKQKDGKTNIRINNISYYLDFDHPYIIKNYNLKFVNFADDIQQEVIKKKFLTKDDKEPITVGTVCTFKNYPKKTYYIFSEFERKWQCYELSIKDYDPSRKNINKNGKANITLNQINFAINLNAVIEIPVKEIGEVSIKITKEEKQKIKEIKEKYENKNIDITIPRFLEKFKKDTIVYNRFTKEKFIIIDKQENKYTLTTLEPSNVEPFETIINDATSDYRVKRDMKIEKLVKRFPERFKMELEQINREIEEPKYIKVFSEKRELLKSQLESICKSYGVPYTVVYNENGAIMLHFDSVPEYGAGPKEDEELPELKLWPEINQDNIKDELLELFAEFEHKLAPVCLTEREYQMVGEFFWGW